MDINLSGAFLTAKAVVKGMISKKAGKIVNISKKLELEFNPLPEVMIKILDDGGLTEHITKNKGFNL